MHHKRRRRGIILTTLIPQIVLLNIMLYRANQEYVGKTTIPAGTTTAYAVTEVYPQEGHVFARLRELNWWANFDHNSKVQRNFIAEVTLDPPAAGEKEGHVRLGTVNEAVTDEFHDHSWFFPVAGKNACVQQRNTAFFGENLYFCDATRHRTDTLATIIARPGHPSYGALAVNRIGSAALVAFAQEVRMGDPSNWAASVREEGPLAEVRKTLATARGNAGDWYLTSDQRFVVVVPSSGIQRVRNGVYHEGGDIDAGAQSMTVANVPFNFDNDALIYDRQLKKASTCGREVNRASLTDVESVDGHLQLLYTKEYEEDRPAGTEYPKVVRVVSILDVSGQVLYKHKVVFLETYVLYAGWNPARKQIWFRVRDIPCHSNSDDIPTEKPEADYHLMVWDAATDTERQGRLTVAEIKAGIDATPKAGR